jgi:hypothetical protein
MLWSIKYFHQNFKESVSLLINKKAFHLAIAIFTLLGSLSGAIATYLLGFLSDIYDTDHNPERLGYLISIFVTFSYISCCPFFLLSSNEYAKILRKKVTLSKAIESPSK